MLERTGMIFTFAVSMAWLIMTRSLSIPFFIAMLGVVIIFHVMYERISPSVSTFFRLTRKTKHEWHLQKNIIPSLFLLSSNSPHMSLRILYRDMSIALYAAINKIPDRGTIIVQTHLFSPLHLKYFSIKPEYQETKPSIFSISLAGIVMWVTSCARFALGRGWNKPHFHTWYRLSIRKH
ncbi:hypothetical protein [Desulfotomaculum copahuensis]|uniref:hypothetical protein n=1 Tax=Desulfotomaculum copahuensis TaxID=1838280 RepID=UPI001248A995|nr:hypothetical protein [Desulfotomaculum copahuensis]